MPPVVGAIAAYAAATAAASAAWSTVAVVAAGAIAGAAASAITSAFMGGDIGKDALWGGIGGAVIGGFVAWGAAAGASSELGSGAASMSEAGAGAGMETVGSTMTHTMGTGYTYGVDAAGNYFAGAGGSVLGSSAGASGSGLAGLAGTMGKDLLVGGIQAYMDYDAKKDLADATKAEADASREWQSAEAEKDRAHQLQLAKLRSDSGGSNALAVAMENNKAAMARQKDQQAHDKAMWGLNRDAKKDDQRAFSDSVIAGSNAQYESKVGTISNFMAAPSWLQPRDFSMVANAGEPQQQQQSRPIQTSQPQYLGQQGTTSTSANTLTGTPANTMNTTNPLQQQSAGGFPQILPQGVG